MGSAASTAYKLGQETSGSGSVGAGLGGIATAAKGAAGQKIGNALGIGGAAERGRQAAWNAGNTASSSSASAASGASGGASGSMPRWARQLQSTQSKRHHPPLATHPPHPAHSGGPHQH